MHEKLSGVRIVAYTTIDDPSAYFQTALWTGNGSTQSITNNGNSDLQPDWIWTKKRNDGQNHHAIDSTRGVSKALVVNDTDAEATKSNGITAFNSDGFSVGTDANFNNNTNTYVAWQWKANGGTTSSNSDGSITSTVQANTTAGFSIITYTGNGASSATIGHGLGAIPQVVILKGRNEAYDWFVGHNSKHSTPWEKYLGLHHDASIADDVIWNDTAHTSSVFSVGSYASTTGSGKTFVAYCFKEIQGYSKFGKYTGNGNADGPFIYLGFKPAWVMFKNLTPSHNWRILDNKRNTFNSNNTDLRPDIADAESSSSDMDFLSNGIKMRDTDGDLNENGQEHIYMAFADNPFVSSKGVPTTAR